MDELLVRAEAARSLGPAKTRLMTQSVPQTQKVADPYSTTYYMYVLLTDSWRLYVMLCRYYYQ